MKGSGLCILNGEIIAEDKAFVSPANRGQMYGDGCFDTLRVSRMHTLRAGDHYQRLREGMAYLGVELSFSEKEFRDSIRQLIQQNDLAGSEALVRTQCWRNGGRGYGSQESSHGWYMSVTPLPELSEAMSLVTVDIPRIPDVALPSRFKWSNGLNYILAAREASEKGADDALMLTTDGRISESSKANVFWIRGEEIFTPSIDCDLLPGITRDVVVSIIGESSYSLSEGSYTPEDLEQAEAIFCTNSIIGVRPVNKIDGRSCTTEHDLVHWIGRTYKELMTIEKI